MRSTSGTGTLRPPPNISAGGDLLGPLVDRRRREHVGGAERAEQRPAVEHAGEVVGVRVADVHGHRLAAVRLEHREQPASISAKASSQVDLHELAVALHERADAAGPGPRAAA